MFWFPKCWEEDMRKLGSTTLLEKKSPNFPSFHSNRSQTSLEHGPKIFLPWKRQFSSQHRTMASRGREMSLKDLNFPLLWIRSSSRWATDGVALGLVAMLHVQNPLDGERCLFPPLLCKMSESAPWVPLRIWFCIGWFSPWPSLPREFWMNGVAT